MTATVHVVHADRAIDVAVGTTALDALKELEATRGQIVAARVTGPDEMPQPWDLDRALPEMGPVAVEGIAADTDEGRAILRHSAAHLMAQAVTDLFPGAKWAIG
ncbi:MAG: hypothetical protein WD041_01400, partial [Nitriliruptoraceae bacterium]